MRAKRIKVRDIGSPRIYAWEDVTASSFFKALEAEIAEEKRKEGLAEAVRQFGKD